MEILDGYFHGSFDSYSRCVCKEISKHHRVYNPCRRDDLDRDHIYTLRSLKRKLEQIQNLNFRFLALTVQSSVACTQR